MRKVILLAFISISLFSCVKEKDYTCQCTYTHDEGTSTTVNVEKFDMTFKSEDVAISNCKNLNFRYSNFNTVGDCVLLK